MKKITCFLGVVALSIASVAAVNDSLLMFSTQGVDAYADGTTVLDGECYALCYVTDAANFSIKADGTAAAGGEVLLTAPVAKDGRCPDLIYVIPAAKAAALTGGAYAVYLLDTRVKNPSGAGYVLSGVTANKANQVNGAGAVAEGGSVATGTSGVAAFNGTVAKGGSVSVATVVDQPAITAIKVEGASVKITVSGLSPVVDYKVQAGTGVADLSKEVSATVEGDTFTVGKDAGSFFKVVGTRKVAQE